MSSASQRRRLYTDQGGLCYYCGKVMTLGIYSSDVPLQPDDCTVEHLQPRCLGGRNGGTNVVAACCRCNNIGGLIDLWVMKCMGASRQAAA